MKSLSCIFITIIILTVNSRAQDNFISVKAGYGAYGMNDLERIQNFLVEYYAQQQLPVSSVDNFSPYWNYQVQFSRKLSESFNLKGFYSFASTGGRVHYSDYSGEIKSEQIVSASFLGIGLEYFFNRMESFRYFTAIQTSVVFSSLDINDLFRIYNQSTKDVTQFNSTGFGIEPLVGAEFDIMSILFRLEFGFLFNASGAFYFSEDSDIELKIEGKEISPNWMGYRIGFSIGFGF